MTRYRDDLACPEGLGDLGKRARAAIVVWLKANDLDHTGGCRAFYSPAEWKARGEEYGITSELVIVHDGGDLAPVFNIDYEMYELQDRMDIEVLRPLGLFAEPCTCWYTAIYKV